MPPCTGPIARGVGIEPTCAGFKAQLAGQQVSPKEGPVRLRTEAHRVCQSVNTYADSKIVMPICSWPRLPHRVQLGEKESNPRSRGSEPRVSTNTHLQKNNRAPPRPRSFGHAARTAVPSLEAVSQGKPRRSFLELTEGLYSPGRCAPCRNRTYLELVKSQLPRHSAKDARVLSVFPLWTTSEGHPGVEPRVSQQRASSRSRTHSVLLKRQVPDLSGATGAVPVEGLEPSLAA